MNLIDWGMVLAKVDDWSPDLLLELVVEIVIK